MKQEKVLIIGNKPYNNLNLNKVVDSFDEIIRFNMAYVGKNNGTKFGNLALCSHMYEHFVINPIKKDDIVRHYGHELEAEFLHDWYDFFQENKNKFDTIFYENPHNWTKWNNMLKQYGSPYKFSKMASSGFSAIFRNLADNKQVCVFGFTLCDEEVRKTEGEMNQISINKNKGKGSHSFTDERQILAWLHNNKKIDASLCMLEDTEGVRLKTNIYNTEPSEFILNLLNKEKENGKNR